mmetsp:Transcript_102586/g.289847  ORF Transcript_102586/g.289847 Transcript_102586/m.289847 type:complete len:214 (-) Transcript_102586:728-1369(-)
MAEELVQGDADGPNVALGALIHGDDDVGPQEIQHGPQALGRLISRVTESQPLLSVKKPGAAVIRDDDLRHDHWAVLRIHQQVVGFQVVVHTADGVEEGRGVQDLLQDANNEALGKTAWHAYHVVVEVASRRVFDNDGGLHIPLLHDQLQSLRTIRVPQLLHLFELEQNVFKPFVSFVVGLFRDALPISTAVLHEVRRTLRAGADGLGDDVSVL